MHTILEVPALKVKFVFVEVAHGLLPVSVTVDDPRLIVRVLLLLEDRIVAVTL